MGKGDRVVIKNTCMKFHYRNKRGLIMAKVYLTPYYRIAFDDGRMTYLHKDDLELE